MLHGIDISSQRARQFVKEDIQTFDRIYIMAKEVLYEMEDICGKLLPSEKVMYLMDAVFPGRKKMFLIPGMDLNRVIMKYLV